MNVQAELQAIGLDEQTAAAVAELFGRSHGMLDGDEPPATNRAQVIVQAAVVTLGEMKRFGDALRTIADWLQRSLSELAPYDIGRYWHVRALISWRFDNALSLATRNLNASTRALLVDGTPRARRYLARVHDSFAQLLHQQGLLTDALGELDRSLELRDPLDRVGLAITHGNRGRLWMDLGDFRKAADDLAIDLAIIEQLSPQLRNVRAQLMSHLGNCELHLGQIDRARSSYEQSKALAVECKDAVADIFATIGLGRVALASGATSAALESIPALGEMVAKISVPERLRASLLASVHKLSADARLASGALDEAIATYESAIRELDIATGSSPMEYAEAYRGLATALAAKQLRPESARALRMALRHLDGTAAISLRREVEQQLQRSSNDSWLLHAAGRFVGQQHIEFLLDEGGKPGFRGSLRKVVALFSDIRGFTTLAEKKPAETVIKFLNEYLTQMTRCIETHGGTVDKFIGDAVMAIFPMDDKLRGVRAIDAALAMRDELERMNRSPLEPEFADLAIGIGIHGGDVVSGLIGSPQKREYTVIGDVVNTASRLEGMTKQLGASTLVTSSVLTDEHRQRYLLRPFGRLTPKGRTMPIEVFDVVGERDGSLAATAMLAEITRVEAALAALAARDFAAAAAAFRDLEHDTRDTPRYVGYAMLGSRARELATKPPAREWSGEITLLEK